MFMLRVLAKAGLYCLGFLSIVAVGFCAGVLWPFEEAIPVNTGRPIIIENISIIDVDSGVAGANQTIHIENGVIVNVGAAEQIGIPTNALIINGSGKYAIPALWDMHTHIFKVTPLLDMPLYIAYGVTNVRDMTSCPSDNDPFAACPDDLRRWSKEAINNQRVGPRIQGITSWMANGPEIHTRINGLPTYFGVDSPQQARDFVHHYYGKVDALKVYDNISREAYFALVDEAKRLGMAVIGHRPHAVSAVEAAQHQKSIEHARFILHESFSGSEALRKSASGGNWSEDRRAMLDKHDPNKAWEIFAAMQNHGTWYVPTHLTRRADAYGEDPLILQDPILKYLHPLMKWQWLEDVNKVIAEDPSAQARQAYRAFYQKGLELTADAHRAGVKVLVGTDYIVAGATVHDEMQLLVQAGLTPLQALQAATVLPAEYFGLQREYGQIKAGMKADLVVLNKNPLENIRNSLSIDSVIFNSNYYDRNILNKLEELVVRRAKSWSIACKIVWNYIKNPVGY